MSTRKSVPGKRRRKAPRRPLSVLMELLRDLPPGHEIDVGGLFGGGPAWLLAQMIGAGASSPLAVRALVVCPDESTADSFTSDLSFFLKASTAQPGDGADEGVLHLSADEKLPYDDAGVDRSTSMTRMAALDRLARGEVQTLVVSARALGQRLPPAVVTRSHGFTLAAGDEIRRDEIARRLSLSGYQNAPIVEDPGSFAIRGGIVDVWSPRHEVPVRIELFGDEIESLRAFDPETQRTISPLSSFDISPVREAIFSEDAVRRATTGVRELAGDLGLPTRSVHGIVDQIERGQTTFGVESMLPAFYPGGLVPLSEWLDGFDLLLVIDPPACDSSLLDIFSRASASYEEARNRNEPVFPPEVHFLRPEEAFDTLGCLRRLNVHELLMDTPHAAKLAQGNAPPRSSTSLELEQLSLNAARRAIDERSDEAGTLAPFARQVSRWRAKGRTIALVASSPGQAHRIKALLEEREIIVHDAEGQLDLERPKTLGHKAVDVHLLVGELSSGFEDPHTGLVIISEADLFGKRRARRSRPHLGRRAEEAFAASFQDLSDGDLVVHVEHGIGRYRGLSRLEVGGFSGDFLVIEYAGRDKIYLPVHRLGLVQRYVGSEADGVRLDRLGSQSFILRKKKVKEELLKVAAELLEIYAARKAHPGTAFSPPDTVFGEFEAAFPHEETEDQKRAIDEVISDMLRPEPMDRLVCGDVGYGKTEVAMRAAMKAVLDGKQVLILVPTTVLAAQHEATFKERFKNYPIIIEAVSRFQPGAKIKEILARTALGRVDILIGTHRLLSRDLVVRDLGLLIIDEEQRFGVAQKERIKRLRRQVDVMTLTATPIPRTLNMSLSGIRDLSIIATPPRDRRSIRTFVSRFNKDTIREAITREIARGGQVFFVHNRVQSIAAMASYVAKIVPEARVIVAHGQMNERALERAMSLFVGRQADVLLSSAIIESGLDMPSVNTIIVNRADTFGLAQLYQLRGRVGRGRERAYCHLLVPARRPMTVAARKRLAVIQQLTELGSGFRLAAHDLEIRGAGSLLGKEQSGQVAAVGFDLYTELLDEAVRELKGEPPREHIDPEVNLPVPAFLPDDYVPDVHQRLLLYKRLSRAGEEHEIDDLSSEIIDRYGTLPKSAENLLRLRGLTLSLASLGAASLDATDQAFILTLLPESDLRAAGLEGAAKQGGRRLIHPRPKAADGDVIEEAERLLGALEAPKPKGRLQGPAGCGVKRRS